MESVNEASLQVSQEQDDLRAVQQKLIEYGVVFRSVWSKHPRCSAFTARVCSCSSLVRYSQQPQVVEAKSRKKILEGGVAGDAL